MSELELTFTQNIDEVQHCSLEFTAGDLTGIGQWTFSKLKKNGDKFVVPIRSRGQSTRRAARRHGCADASAPRVSSSSLSLTLLLCVCLFAPCRCQFPQYQYLMEHCSVTDTRRALEFAYNEGFSAKNTPILAELIRLRAERAELLGYPNHAAYMLETCMAKTPETAASFLRDLSSKLTPLLEAELQNWKWLKAKEARAKGARGSAATVKGQTIHSSVSHANQSDGQGPV